MIDNKGQNSRGRAGRFALVCKRDYFADLATCFWLLMAASVFAEVIELEGTVKSVDAATRVITIERKTPSGTKTLELEVTKKAGDIASLNPGDEITFNYDPDLELVTRIGDGNGKTTQPQEAADKASLASEGPGEREKEICREACRKLEQQHFLEPRIDRDLTEKMLEAYLRSLDPMKLYFLQSDIDLFTKSAADLPTALKEGDTTFAYLIYDRLIERVSSRLPVIESLITKQHDFTKDESLETNQAATKWASTDAEVEDKWRRRVKYDMLVSKMQGEKEGEVKEKLLRRYRSFKNRMMQMTSDELLEQFLNALYQSVDGQSVYMSPETLANFEIQMRSQLDGIGAQLKSEDGLVSIVALMPGGAAAKDGRLQPGDGVVGVAQGSSDDFVDVQDMRINDVVILVRGERGSVVRLKVVSTGSSVPRVYDITRSKIELQDQDVTGEVFAVGRKLDGSPWRVGVVKIPYFYCDMEAMRRGEKNYKSAPRDCKALLEGFRRQKVDCVIVDVRDNGGGVASEFAASVGLFIDRGRVVQIKQKDGTVNKIDDRENGSSWQGPLVVLVNRRTSGGAELFAGAIQDHNRGIIVGDEFTNGRVPNMNIIPLAQNKQLGSVKLLWALMYRPSGEGVQGKGIRSDLALPSILDALTKQEESGVKERVFDRLPSAGFIPAEPNPVDDLVDQLKKKSGVRLNKNQEFRDLVKRLQDIKKRNQSGRIPLNEAEFEKEWKKGQVESTSLTADGEKSGRATDFYMDEVLNIASDMCEILN